MVEIKEEQSDHLQQNSPLFTPRLSEHNSETPPTASSSQFDGGQDVSVVIRGGAAQGILQDPHTTGMAGYGMAEHSSPPVTMPRFHTHIPPPNVQFVKDIPEQQQVISPVNPVNNQLGHALRGEIPNHIQAPVPHQLAHHIPLLGRPTAWNPRPELRQQALELQRQVHDFMQNPALKVDDVFVKHISTSQFNVTITLVGGAPPLDPPTAGSLRQLANHYTYNSPSQIPIASEVRILGGRHIARFVLVKYIL